VIPEGTTREERLDLDEIRERLSAGVLAPSSLVFSPEDKKWLSIADREEFEDLVPGDSPGAIEADEDGSDESCEAAEEYRSVQADLAESPGDFDLLARAGRLALAAGDAAAAREHYQRALHLKPFHPRLRQEIVRGFHPKEQAKFVLLTRKPPFWEDPSKAVGFPVSISGWPGFLALGAILGGLLFIPYGATLFYAACFVLMVNATKHAGGGYKAESSNPLSMLRLLVPSGALLAAGVVLVEIFLPFAVTAAVSLAVSGESPVGVIPFVAGSPVMVVLLFMLFCGYVPAVLAVSAAGAAWLEVLDPMRVFRSIGAMDTEYPASAAAIAFVVLVWLSLRGVLESLSIPGRFLEAVSGMYVSLFAGYLAGLLFDRYRHVIRSEFTP
jgi:hypothetical protein